MNVPGSIESGATDEEVEKYLSEFARRVGGWAAREPRRQDSPPGPPSWAVGGGTFLSTNPNTVPWRLRVARREGRLEFHATMVRLPWTRRKGARIAAWRQGQLADYLETRLRGGAPEKFDERRLRAPFAPFGATAAAISASFAWSTACACGALALAFLALLLPCLALMHGTAGEIAGRVRAIEAAGDIPLPSPAEIASVGFGARLGAAALLALPVAFFLGLVHALALLAGEAWPRASRLGLASAAFQAIFLGLAFLPLISFAVAIPSALLVPLAAHAGYTLVWGRRKERVREGNPPRRALVVSGAVVALAVAVALVPRPAAPEDFKDRLALFRDRYLAGHPLGKAAVRFYYKYTLYTVNPVKRFFTTDPKVLERSQRTAWVPPGSEAGTLLRKLDFSVPPGGDPGTLRFDVVAADGALRSGGAEVRWDPKSGIPGLNQALNDLSEQAFRGGQLLELTALSWRAVYYLGPLFAAVLFIGICCPMVSVIFRAMPWRSAVISVTVCLASTVGLMLWDYSRHSEVHDRVDALRGSANPDAIARGLGHPSVVVRHEAAFRAFRLKEGQAALADALLKAADDPDLRVRLWASAALGKTRDPRALDKLAERLKDPEFLVRYRAAEGLGFLGDRKAVEPLQDLMRRGSWYEGLYALQALRRIDPDRF